MSAAAPIDRSQGSPPDRGGGGGDRLRLFAHGGGRTAHPNTLEGLDAAAEAGADAIEFDVLVFGRRLVLAHTPLDALRRARRLVTLAEAAEHLAADHFGAIHFNVDLKAPGYERAAVDHLDRAGVLDRCLFSSMFAGSLRAVKAHRPDARTGLSVGDDLARLVLRWPRRGDLRDAILTRVRESRCETVMLFHRLASGALIGALGGAGLDLVCWTVNCPLRATVLHDLGVRSLATDDLPALRGVA